MGVDDQSVGIFPDLLVLGRLGGRDDARFAGLRPLLEPIGPVEITHGNGYVTRYAHNAKLLVKPGQTVKRGDAIALMGSTGRSTGTHVHFEVLRDARPMNPLSFVKR